MKRRIVLVSGAPAAGKTSLAVPLAKVLKLPLIAKDDLKETLVDVLGDHDGDLGWSRKVGGAAMDLLWKLAERAKTAHAAHPARALTPEWIAEFDQPMGLGPVIEVDTTQPVDVQALADQIAALLGHPD